MLSKLCEYIPVALIGVLLIAEEDIHNHALKLSWQISILTLTMALFFILVIKCEQPRHKAFIACLILWVMMIYVKQKYT
jgi:hypothetical protein